MTRDNPSAPGRGEHVLIVDDEVVFRRNVVRYLQREGYRVSAAGSGAQALEVLDREDVALLITDLRMPGMSGTELLRQVAVQSPQTMCLVITANASVESAVLALRLGAHDYILKPLMLDELARKIGLLLHTQALEARVHRLRHELQRVHTPGTLSDGMIAQAPAMVPVLHMLSRAAPTRTTVLIEGESGTGKELIARALHARAPWADRDFIAVSLGAVPAELIDATLFGHERGAFTGAVRSRLGVFRAANGGTVFLDEIGELSHSAQVKLLRVLESREITPIGSDHSIPVEFRLVTATHRDLHQRVEEGRFRADLYFRLSIFPITLPPLRERRADIPALAQHFLRQHAARQGRPPPQLSSAAMRWLCSYDWPGNVRELNNAIERAVLLCDEQIAESDLPSPRRSRAAPVALKPAIEHFERQHIASVLLQCDGDKARAAGLLQVHLSTLYRHIERLGLEK